MGQYVERKSIRVDESVWLIFFLTCLTPPYLPHPPFLPYPPYLPPATSAAASRGIMISWWPTSE